MIDNPTPGMRVRVSQLISTRGMIVNSKHIEARELHATGVLTQPVPGHGGDVWAVKHNYSAVAVYSLDELEAR